MTAGSDDLGYSNMNNNPNNNIFVSKIGLAGSHAYSILGIYELYYTKQSGYQLLDFAHRKQFLQQNQQKLECILKLRNPWGKGEWKGKWNDNDKNWNRKLR